jgi:hypothetical protein
MGLLILNTPKSPLGVSGVCINRIINNNLGPKAQNILPPQILNVYGLFDNCPGQAALSKNNNQLTS